MSETNTEQVIFTTGGTVQAGNGTYLSRRADADLLALCQDSAFAYILTARQMGKSSLMTRTAESLIEEGVKPVIIDLTAIGVNVDAEQWYLGLLAAIEDQIELDTNVVSWWQAHQHLGMTQRLTLFFQEILLKEVPAPERIVIFVDEIDTTLSLGFTDDFFAAIRYLYNARANNADLHRLSFVLIGVATPSDLIRDPQRTPFNIGQRVELADFTIEEALPFAAGLQLPPDQARQVLRWVMNWTSGHPYLTQRLCLALIDQQRQHWTEAEVDRVVESTFSGDMSEQDNNLQFVRDMLTKRAPDKDEVLTTYKEILTRPVPDEEQSLIKSHLKLSGVVRREGGQLRLRNRIYQTVFDKTWVSQHLPVNWTKRLQRAAYFAAATLLILNVPVGVYGWIQRNEAVSSATDLKKANKELEKAIEEVKKAKREADEAKQAAEEQREVAESQTKIATAQRKRAEELQQEAEKSRQNAAQQRDLAMSSSRDAKEQGQIAYSRELASSSISQLQIDPALSLALADESIQVKYTPQAEDALRQSLVANPLRAEFTGHTAAVISAAYSPDGKFIVTASADKTARVWEVATGREVRQLQGHTAVVNSAAYSPDGKFIVTGSYDKTARVWDAATGREVRQLQGHTAEVISAAFSPDGKFIVTGSADKTARIYPDELFMPYEQLLALARTRPVRALTDVEREKYLHESRRGAK